MKPKKKKSDIQNLVTKLDNVFSKWIRRRDSDDEFGIIQCVTCGKPMDLKTAQNGHFISRRHYATRWEEKNCAAQCVGCNLFNQGKQYEFGLAIDKRFGAGTTEKLLIQSRNKFNLNKTVLEILIKKYSVILLIVTFSGCQFDNKPNYNFPKKEVQPYNASGIKEVGFFFQPISFNPFLAAVLSSNIIKLIDK